jgi:hypothetical protein
MHHRPYRCRQRAHGRPRFDVRMRDPDLTRPAEESRLPSTSPRTSPSCRPSGGSVSSDSSPENPSRSQLPVEPPAVGQCAALIRTAPGRRMTANQISRPERCPPAGAEALPDRGRPPGRRVPDALDPHVPGPDRGVPGRPCGRPAVTGAAACRAPPGPR